MLRYISYSTGDKISQTGVIEGDIRNAPYFRSARVVAKISIYILVVYNNSARNSIKFNIIRISNQNVSKKECLYLSRCQIQTTNPTPIREHSKSTVLYIYNDWGILCC